jgi:DNA invertase Pin-like site-specific DNA recombinase
VIYKPDRVARSMKELLVFIEDELHARGITLEILTGGCAGVHRPDGAGLAHKLLFAVAALAAEMERELIRGRTLDGLRAGHQAGAAWPAAGRRKVRDEHQHGHLPHHGQRSLRSRQIF